MTKALWQEDNLEALNQPAPNPNIRVFASHTHGDMLVVYDELSEHSGAVHTRAYWLNENEKLRDQGRMPHFSSTNSVFSLTPIPVMPVTTNHISYSPPPYAQIEFDQHSFTLFLEHSQAGPYKLPVYKDAKGKFEKFALTPLTTAADATLIGGFLGFIYLHERFGSGSYNPSY